MYTPQPGDMLTKDGRTIEIDFVKDGQVYWYSPGGLFRASIAAFSAAVAAEQPAITKAAERAELARVEGQE